MSDLKQEFEVLLTKYTELLTGHDTEDVIDKVKIWALYSHIKKTMPALIQHWHSDNPETNSQMRSLFEEVQKLNQEHKASMSKSKP